MADEKNAVVEVSFGASSFVSEAIKDMLTEEVRSGRMASSMANLIPGIKLTVLGQTGDIVKIGFAYQSGDLDKVAGAWFEAFGGLVGGAAGGATFGTLSNLHPIGRVTRPIWVGLGAAGGGWAGGEFIGEPLWEETKAQGYGQWVKAHLPFVDFSVRIQEGSTGGTTQAKPPVTPDLYFTPGSSAEVPVLIWKPENGNYINPTGQALERDPDVPLSDISYMISKGDSLWKIAYDNGIDYDTLLAANTQITHPALIHPGQIINLPSLAVDNSLLNITTNTNPQPTLPDAIDETFGAGSINQGYLDFDATSSVWMPTNFVNGNGWANQTPGAISSDDYRPGEGSLLSDTLFDLLAPPTVQDFGYTNNSLSGAGWLNNTSQQSFLSTYVDPLVLDLNNDGVKLTDYTTNPVLFDIDNDGGTKEVAGWSSAQDGIVVMDLNGNGKIDNIAETFSEYFNGTAGVGEAGTKPYADGFAALKSLDSNNDNLFNSSDTAFANVKVWVDANHDALTDAGELKTLAALSISQINLNAQTQSGLVRDGNEVLATGSFVQAGLTKEAIAANAACHRHAA